MFEQREMLSAAQLRAVASLDDPLGPLLALLVYTGLRTGEALTLTWADVDLEAEKLTVAASLGLAGHPLQKSPSPIASPQSGERAVPLVPSAVAALRRQRSVDEPSAPRGLVFASAKGSGLPQDRLARRWRALRAERSLPAATLDDLRRSIIGLLLAHGVDQHAMAAAFGASDLSGHIRVPVPSERVRDLFTQLEALVNGS